MKIGDICKCKSGKIGMILDIKKCKDGSILYRGKTLGESPGLPWQSVSPKKVGDFHEIENFVLQPQLDLFKMMDLQ